MYGFSLKKSALNLIYRNLNESEKYKVFIHDFYLNSIQ